MSKIETLLHPFPQKKISLLPTPFHYLDNISCILGRDIYIKRDDLTGFALSGNKTRKFDFLVADALKQNCDTIIGIGANQSNFCRILSGVGAKYGLEVHLILNGKKPARPTGNLLIDHMLGAAIHHVDTEDADIRRQAAQKTAADLRVQGKKVYFLPPGGSTPIGTLGYAAGFAELLEDFKQQKVTIDKIFHASSSAGTQAGLVLGQAISQWPGQIIGISVDVPEPELKQKVYQLSQAAGDLLGVTVARSQVFTDGNYIGPGYAKHTPECEAAVDLFAKQEGVFLDYVYTGKAAAGLIDYCQRKCVGPQEKVAFIHTGGNIELFE